MRRISVLTAGLLAVAASVTVIPSADATTISIDGCTNAVFLVPAGTVVDVDYSACGADITVPVTVDRYTENGIWISPDPDQPTGTSPAFTFTTLQTLDDLYANTTVTQLSPFATQIHVFFFVCGTSPEDYTTNVMDPTYNAHYVTFSQTMPTTSLCSSTADGGSSPPPVIQQFGKPQLGRTSTGSCDALAPSTSNWAGVPSGGWGESWAQWVNDGRGGAVCSRTLVYSNALGRWVVG